MTAARFYFDFISPYSFLYVKRWNELPPLDIEFVPILYPALLKRWSRVGPAEVAAQRVHTYQQCLWIARRHGIAMRLPASHPFNPLAYLRLALVLGPSREVVEQIFDFLWTEGREPATSFYLLAARLSVSDSERKIGDPAIKRKLMENTAEAIQRGVFGVPTMALGERLFWGQDSIPWLRDFVADAALFDDPEMRRAERLPVGVTRPGRET